METTLEQAVNALKKKMKEDPDLAWTWHSNVTMPSFDEGLSIAKANRAAARFMKNAFDVDVTKHDNYKRTQE